jgi:hypothetical protein
MDFIDILETTTELRSIGPKIDLEKRPERITIEYTIGSPTKNICKAEESEHTDNKNLSS